MFSVKGDTDLDPFLGLGTTTRIAAQNERNSVGYEIDGSLTPLIESNLGDLGKDVKITISNREPFST